MKKRILFSAIFAILVTAVVALSDFVPDVIVTSPNGLWTDTRAYNTIDAAITAIGANDRDIYVVRQEATTALTIPSNVSLHFFASGSIANTGQLTLNTRQIFAGDHQIFTGTGDIDFSSGSVIRSAWFSSAIEAFYRTTDDNITLVISKSAFITANRSVGNNVNLRWEAPNNRLTANAGYTLSNIKNIEAGSFQLFAGAGTFSFVDGIRLNLSWFARLRSALTWINTTRAIIEFSGDHTVDYTDTVPSNVSLKSISGVLTVSAGQVLTINGSFDSGLYQTFSITSPGDVIFGSKSVKKVYPVWFGETFNSCPLTRASFTASSFEVGIIDQLTGTDTILGISNDLLDNDVASDQVLAYFQFAGDVDDIGASNIISPLSGELNLDLKFSSSKSGVLLGGENSVYIEGGTSGGNLTGNIRGSYSHTDFRGNGNSITIAGVYGHMADIGTSSTGTGYTLTEAASYYALAPDPTNIGTITNKFGYLSDGDFGFKSSGAKLRWKYVDGVTWYDILEQDVSGNFYLRSPGFQKSIYFKVNDGSDTTMMTLKYNRVNLNSSYVAVYADNATAIAAGLVAGDVYKTATGQLMIVY